MKYYELKMHNDTKDFEYSNKSGLFFKQQKRQFAEQQQKFKQLMVAHFDQTLVMLSLKITHVLMSQKKPLTLAKNILKPCLKILVQNIYGGATAVTKVQKLELSDNFLQRCSLIAASVKEIVLAMLCYATCSGLQLIKLIDFIGQAQLVVHARFSDMELIKIVDHYRFCLPIGIDINAQSVF